ncbi:hypothetical protein [Paraburkholderia sartisoli]|uniref:Uncharacterized protein n=1 Tax=Paraburkholderia sartisoli TaxID=83784 RepID=A0A1H4A9R5_9BURK|nr:hypothetical protein [Paraburkholderia sartisoli]SEA32660.1 hypothetical protein SAMN05192564_1011088 [Paraburkholderia sartisoli]
MVIKILVSICFLIVLAWGIATTSLPGTPKAMPCTQEWFSYVDKNYFEISDGEGHGPDLGSGEWLGVVEAKAGLPVENLLPPQQRCQLIQDQFRRHTYIINRPLGWSISF